MSKLNLLRLACVVVLGVLLLTQPAKTQVAYYKSSGGGTYDALPIRIATGTLSGDVIIGRSAAPSITWPSNNNNVIIGSDAASSLVSGADDIVAIGRGAWGFGDNTTDTVAIGALAAWGGCTGSVFIGVEAGYNCGVKGGLHRNTSGNVGVGKFALTSNQDGSNNTAMGRSSLQDFQPSGEVATNNTALGYASGRGVTTGVGNTFLGANCNIGNVSNNVVLCDGDGNVRAKHDGTEWILGAGGLQYQTASKPTCAVGIRGMTWYVAGAAGVADTFEICRKDAANAYAWVTLF